MLRVKSWAAVLGMTIALSAHAATADEPQDYIKHPLIDITKNPGCGVSGLSSTERVERNRRIAQVLIQSYAEIVPRKQLIGMGRYDCWAKDMQLFTLTFGVGKPYDIHPTKHRGGTPTVGAASVYKDKNGRDIDNGETEMVDHFKYFRDWRVMPGSFEVYPWDSGATLRVVWEYHSMDGVYYQHWEKIAMLISDDGRITLFEDWNDPIAMQKWLLGRGIKSDVTLAEYMDLSAKRFEASSEKTVAEVLNNRAKGRFSVIAGTGQ